MFIVYVYKYSTLVNTFVFRELALQIVPRLAALQPTLVNAINTDNLDVVNSITRIVTGNVILITII